jgi:2-polyprenyl-3-methyl-5-hydroxy-6-metoxy-1,4-benzoquinol methylase
MSLKKNEFLKYNQEIKKSIDIDTKHVIHSFLEKDLNFDVKTVDSFGEEWLKFSGFSDEEIKIAGDQYFDIVYNELLNKDTIVLDLGCGTGRWTKYVANKVKLVEAVDPSEAILSAHKLTSDLPNVRITQASVSNIPFDDESFDFIICLGVLHHIPDTQKALIDLCKKMKPNGHLLLYLYYSLDNRGRLYKLLFHISSIIRKVVASLPSGLKKLVCDLIALLVYFPFVSLNRFLKGLFGNKKWIKKLPLSYYADKSMNIIRNDALDRFGTPLEQRFSKIQIEDMLKKAGINNCIFSNNEPFWHVLGKKE